MLLAARSVGSMDDASRERLRQMFSDGAIDYERSRPGYPERLFADLAGIAELTPVSRVLELGCGTGQATAGLARLGVGVTALDLSPEMAAAAARNVAAFPKVVVTAGAFEDWPLPDEPFDVVFAATAFHWLDPAVRMRKSADALRPGGFLAIAGIRQVAGGSSEFFDAAVRLYAGLGLKTAQFKPPPPAEALPRDASEFAECGLFERPVFFRYEWSQAYTASELIALLATFSEFRALSGTDQGGLVTSLQAELDRRGLQEIEMRYLAQLAAAPRL